MEDATPIAEEPMQAEPLAIPRVDINQATEPEFTSLPGIGAAMANQIITYRETHGPFLLPEEIIAVPGIGEISYQRFADRLEATLPAELPPSREETQLEEAPELPEPDFPEIVEELQPVAVAEEIPIEDELPAEEIILAEETPVVEPDPQVEPPPPEPEPVPPPPPPPAPAPPRRRVTFGWFWTALLGGFLGLIFTLLVLAGINGSLDIDHSQALIAMRADMENVAAEMESLQGDIKGLRQRLDTLESLTARMEEVETNVQALETQTNDLAMEIAALQAEDKNLADEIKTLEGNLTALERGVEKSHAFFTGMRELITDIFGKAEAAENPLDFAPSKEVSPMPTPTPNE
ncbi:MAG: helix-hairpin-helix domain-containing protein [Chloroflexota bacterium]|nr:helix-hairpin-helix domain-containing protein [Chloroflexota bacterium]